MTMSAPRAAEIGRVAFRARQWTEAFAALADAERDSALEPTDFELMAVAAYLIGRDDESLIAWRRAHEAWRAAAEPLRAHLEPTIDLPAAAAIRWAHAG